MGQVIDVADMADLKRIMEAIPPPEPGQECQLCHRKYPEKKSDDPTGPKREVLTIHIPHGFPPLDPLLIDLVDKYQEQWPLEHAAMRDQIGLEVVGGRSWKYHAIHFSTYACLIVPGLEPTE